MIYERNVSRTTEKPDAAFLILSPHPILIQILILMPILMPRPILILRLSIILIITLTLTLTMLMGWAAVPCSTIGANYTSGGSE